MKFRPLGNTGMDLSVLSFGASSLGQEFRQVDIQEALQSVPAALDCGMNIPLLRTGDVGGPAGRGTQDDCP